MLCDSTKILLQAIIHSLETPEPAGWDDQIESGKQCLYEMHQMTRPSYRAYKTAGSDKWPSHVPDGAGLTRALPYVKAMVSAIRRKDRMMAVQSGNAALAEMNGSRPSTTSGSKEPGKEVREASPVVRQHEKPARKHRPVVEKRASSRPVRVASST